MFQAHPHLSTEARRGVILMIVLALLTLFAIVGLSFVLYAGSAAKSSQIARDAEVQSVPDVDPEVLAGFFLGQLIYDADDVTGIYSALRGHSLARSMYGWYYPRQGQPDPSILNTVPFNGLGRLHTGQANGPLPFMNPFGLDDYYLINYTYYQTDQFIRDPERLARTAAGPGQYAGGFNAPYTYPDLNNMFLAAVRADGTVLMPSYHRPWLFGSLLDTAGTLTPFNKNSWTTSSGKYMTLRPRPIDQLTQAQVISAGLPWPLAPEKWTPAQLTQFQPILVNLIATLQAQGKLLPYPEDEGGDVKNLVGARGYLAGTNYANNDSIWIDLGFPVMTAANGQKFKPLFAPLIVDLDNRINLNVHGNVRGQNSNGQRFFVANQCWGPWTVDVSQVLNAAGSGANPAEWQQLFGGSNSPIWPGRYGLSPDPAGSDQSYESRTPHNYARIDYDECDPNRNVTQSLQLPTGTNCFPTYPAGYDNYLNKVGNNIINELANHPSVFNVFQPVPGQQNRFPVSDLEALLRAGETGSPSLTSNLMQLCPNNFSPPLGVTVPTLSANPAVPPLTADQRRRLVTVRSFDVERPGVTPWLTKFLGASQGGSGPQDQGNTSNPMPVAGPPTFALPPQQSQQLQLQAVQTPNDFTIAQVGPILNQYGTDWRCATAALGRLDLNRPLPPYPPVKGGVISDNKGFQAAELARQQLAEDIYVRLLSATGVYDPFQNPASPLSNLDTTRDVPALRSLAQLAVNIVDLIDDDEYSTPFHWGAIGSQNFVLAVEQNGQSPQWVFGVEMPHVLINEAYAQFQINNQNVLNKPHNTQVNVWVELYNPLSPESGFYDNGNVHLDSGAGNYRGYRLLLAKPWSTTTSTPTDTYMRRSDNPLGTPRRFAPGANQDMGVFQTTTNGQYAIVNFLNSNQAPVVSTSSGGPGPQGYLVIAPSGSGLQLPGLPASSPQVYPRPEMTYAVPDNDPDLVNIGSAGAPLYRPAPPTVVLQRLACPYRPLNPLPNDPEFPGMNNPSLPINPYITVDYFSDVNKAIQGTTIYIQSQNKVPLSANSAANSEGRSEPFVGYPGDSTTVAGGPRSPKVVQKSLTSGKQNPQHTFLSKNNGPGTAANFDWLVHLDRQLTSPMELMNVAAVKPGLLTQEFIHPPPGGSMPPPFNHHVPWYDEDLPASLNASHRLYRFFEYVATRSRAAGLQAPICPALGQVASSNQISVTRLSWLTPSGTPAIIKEGDVLVLDKFAADPSGNSLHENVRVQAITPATGRGTQPGQCTLTLVSPLIKHSSGQSVTIELTTMGERVPGKININTIWDPQTFYALAAATPSQNYDMVPGDTTGLKRNPMVDTANVFQTLIAQRTPGLRNNPPALSASDQPFLGMAAGQYGGSVPFYSTGPAPFSGPANYGPSGVNHTLLGPAQPGGPSNSKRLLQVPFTTPNTAIHPFIANQLLTRLFNNVTTRSNVFAVWVTVGFFEVIDDTVRPVKLGAEIGKAENRQIRHRMFSVVDRTALTVPSVIGFVQKFTNPGPQLLPISQPTNYQIPIGPTPPIGRTTLQQLMRWTIQPGDTVVVGEGTPNQETVTVYLDPQTQLLAANFTRTHFPQETVSVHVLPGNPGPVTASNPGNPGQVPAFNPRDQLYQEVVPYLSIIQ
jgi:hypothetical protein